MLDIESDEAMTQDDINDVLKLTLPAADSPSGISRKTWTRVAESCGLSEVEAIQLAMAQFAARVAPGRFSPNEKRPPDLKGMDLAPLDRLMQRHDAEWRL